MASATLSFHDVTDWSVRLGGSDGRFQVASDLLWIEGVEREPVVQQLVCVDRPNFAWRISVLTPWSSGYLRFGASWFTQVLRQEPITSAEQGLAWSQRAPFFDAT